MSYTSDVKLPLTKVDTGPLVARTDNSNGGMLFDATGDGSADDVMVFNAGEPNEVLVSDGAGTFTTMTSGPLVARTDNSMGGMLFDATGDGSADDVMVLNSDEANEVLVSDGAGTFTAMTSGPLVACSGSASGGILFDATGDGSADDVMVFNQGEANEVLVYVTRCVLTLH